MSIIEFQFMNINKLLEMGHLFQLMKFQYGKRIV